MFFLLLFIEVQVSKNIYDIFFVKICKIAQNMPGQRLCDVIVHIWNDFHWLDTERVNIHVSSKAVFKEQFYKFCQVFMTGT